MVTPIALAAMYSRWRAIVANAGSYQTGIVTSPTNTASRVAADVGMDPRCVLAGELPGGKAGHVARMEAAGRRCAMVGDGINDAPALKRASLGVAIGAGAQIAVQAADVVLLNKGGHSLEIIEEADIIEIKQGPYAEGKDKTRFETPQPSEIIELFNTVA